MKLTKLLVAVLAVNQCDAVADYCVVTAAKVGTDLVAGKTLEGTGSAVLQAAAAINPLAAAGILATAWTASTVADSYFEHQTLQAEELTKQAKELTKQAEARAKQAEELTKQLLLLSRLNTNMNEFEPEQISNMNGFRHTVK